MATNFLWYTGTSANTGLLATAQSLLTTEMNSLASAGYAVSSVGGTSGVFNNSNFAQGIWAELYLTLGAIGTAMVAGANFCGWFAQSYDGGTTFEVHAAALSRPADFIVPLPAATVTTGQVFKAVGPVLIPAQQFYVGGQNNTGQAFAASGNVLRAAPMAMQY